MKDEDGAGEELISQISGDDDSGEEARFAAEIQGILGALPFYVMLVGADHHILLANEAVKRDLGLDPDQIIGRYCPKVVHGLDGPFPGCPLEEAAESGQAVERELFDRSSRRWMNSAIYPTRYQTKEGQAIYLHMVHDITEQKQAQDVLIQAEKLTIAGRLAASLAHEINNPLQAAIGCLGLEEEGASRYLGVALDELRRAAGIVGRLRNLHRPSELAEGRPTDVNRLLERVLMLTRGKCRSQRVEVIWTPADLPQLMVAPDQMQQVFLNLLLNALDAMPKGGQLSVSTGLASKPAELWVAFADSGVGIAPVVLPHMFEPFYSAKPGGMGLGLFISQNIVTNHGGRIEVETRVGEGSKFTVWLPA